MIPIHERNKQRPVVIEITPTESTVEEESAPQNQEVPQPPVQDDVYGPLLKGVERKVKEEDDSATEMERNLRQQLEKNMRHPDPSAADQKLLSRAERRKLIKDEIRRLSHVEGPLYQRRLW